MLWPCYGQVSHSLYDKLAIHYMNQSRPLSSFGQNYVAFGSYHHDPINQCLHFIALPLMTATIIAALALIPLSIPLAGYHFSVADLAVAGLLVYYGTLDLTFAAGVTLISAAYGAAWQAAFEGMEQGKYMLWILGLHVFTWVLNIVGHKYFEKRKPSLLENITQTISGPIFMVVILLERLGLRSPEMGDWQAQISRKVEEWNKKEKQGEHRE